MKPRLPKESQNIKENEEINKESASICLLWICLTTDVTMQKMSAIEEVEVEVVSLGRALSWTSNSLLCGFRL